MHLRVRQRDAAALDQLGQWLPADATAQRADRGLGHTLRLRRPCRPSHSTTLVEQDNATLWRTYIMLTELESVFRSLKTDLGLRPVFHRTDRRVEGHLFISVLAYHFVHTLRLQLKEQGIHDSWNTLRQTMATQRRVTVTLQRRDSRVVHVRKPTRPKPRHQTLGTALKFDPNPGRTHRVLV